MGISAVENLVLIMMVQKIVYSTKSFNLLPETIERDDGKTFYNSSFRLPTARAILAGPIDEIEILNKGSGYSGGFLIIEDLSGAGSGAQASYEVDQRGSVVSIQVINSGQNYRLDTTRISIAEPLGGSGVYCWGNTISAYARAWF